SPVQAERVIAHELGHIIDDMAGSIPTAGLNTELRQIYNTLNTGQERTRHLTGPQHFGYGEADVPKELMADAIRAYLADPNYLKTVAPKTAARIREWANPRPTLSKIDDRSRSGFGEPTLTNPCRPRAGHPTTLASRKPL